MPFWSRSKAPEEASNATAATKDPPQLKHEVVEPWEALQLSEHGEPVYLTDPCEKVLLVTHDCFPKADHHKSKDHSVEGKAYLTSQRVLWVEAAKGKRPFAMGFKLRDMASVADTTHGFFHKTRQIGFTRADESGKSVDLKFFGDSAACDVRTWVDKGSSAIKELQAVPPHSLSLDPTAVTTEGAVERARSESEASQGGPPAGPTRSAAESPVKAAEDEVAVKTAEQALEQKEEVPASVTQAAEVPLLVEEEEKSEEPVEEEGDVESAAPVPVEDEEESAVLVVEGEEEEAEFAPEEEEALESAALEEGALERTAPQEAAKRATTERALERAAAEAEADLTTVAKSKEVAKMRRKSLQMRAEAFEAFMHHKAGESFAIPHAGDESPLGPVVLLVTSLRCDLQVHADCDDVKEVLKRNRVAFKEIDGNEPDNRAVRNHFFDISGKRGAYPQLFAGEGFIGDAYDVEEMDSDGTLRDTLEMSELDDVDEATEQEEAKAEA